MNKKGFTLVELLAVITILALLALITSTSVTKLVKDAKEDLYDTQIGNIKSAAMAWGSENPNLLPEDGECNYLTLLDLKEYGLMDSSVINSKDNTELSDDLKIKISSSYSTYGVLDTTYEVGVSVNGCSKIYDTICSKVTSTEKGTVPTGKYVKGDAYNCTVKSGTTYKFYVVSSDDKRVNLIMDSNISKSGSYADSTSNIDWISQSDFITYGGTLSTFNTGDKQSLGPITALNYLYEATKNWDIPNIAINHSDEGEHFGSYKTSGNYLDLYDSSNNKIISYKNIKARLPYASEVLDKNLDWKLDNLDTSSNLNGYWTLDSTLTGSTINALKLSSYTGDEYGVRPVISIPKSRITN